MARTLITYLCNVCNNEVASKDFKFCHAHCDHNTTNNDRIVSITYDDYDATIKIGKGCGDCGLIKSNQIKDEFSVPISTINKLVIKNLNELKENVSRETSERN